MSRIGSPIGRTLHALALTAAVAALALAAPSDRAGAQERVDARTVAARVQRFHDQTTTFSASFYQTFYNRLYARYDRAHGYLAFKKPGRLRFDYARPNGKQIVSNGTELTVYEPGAPGSSGQYWRSPMRDGAIPQAFSFLTGTSRLESDFTFRLLDARAWRFDGPVLEMRPRQRTASYARVILFVDAHRDRLGVVHRVLVVDHDGNRNKFELTTQRYNRPIADGAFAWSPPQGARRIAL